MRGGWVIQQKKLDSTKESNKVENKQFMAREKGIVYHRKQMFVCEKMVETKTSRESSSKSLDKGPACFGRMDKSLQLLKKEMVELAYLNVQLMEKMIEMQSQIESIKQERVDFMLELYRSEQFEKKIERFSIKAPLRGGQKSRNGSIIETTDQDSNITDFFVGRIVSSNERNFRPGRKSTIDSLSSLPSVSSMQSEGSFSPFETETEEDFCFNENETASSDSGIEIRCEALDLDVFHSAATSDV